MDLGGWRGLLFALFISSRVTVMQYFQNCFFEVHRMGVMTSYYVRIKALLVKSRHFRLSYK